MNPLARFRRREVAPVFAFGGQLLVKDFQDLVLETAAFARVQLEKLPLPGAQAGTDEKLERALGKLLQPAYGSLQHRAEKSFRQRGRKIFVRRRLAQLPQFFRE